MFEMPARRHARGALTLQPRETGTKPRLEPLPVDVARSLLARIPLRRTPTTG
jgi:hypothetical protein